MIESMLTLLIATAVPPPAVLVAPASIDLGVIEAGTQTTVSVWLLNTATEPVEVLSARPSCRCVAFVDFEPVELEPLFAREVQLTVEAPKIVGPKQTKHVRFVFDSGEKVTLEIRVASSHPLVANAKSYLEAREKNASVAVKHLAPEARFWLGDLEGTGHPLRDAASERLFGAAQRFGEFRVSGRSVTAVAWEIDDAQRQRISHRATLWFNEPGRIEKLLIVAVPQEPLASRADSAE